MRRAMLANLLKLVKWHVGKSGRRVNTGLLVACQFITENPLTSTSTARISRACQLARLATYYVGGLTLASRVSTTREDPASGSSPGDGVAQSL